MILMAAENDIQLRITEHQQQADFRMHYYRKLSNYALVVYRRIFMVPHLVTALNGPLLELEKTIIDSTPAIERWFRLEWQDHTPPFYCSVDLRNAGCKLAPVDNNLFPGGFNNLSVEM